MKDKIYIFHKNGANSHYVALDFLLRKHNKELIYREFSVFGCFYKSIKRLDYQLFYKQILNSIFIIKLLFSKNLKVVLGIAPFDPKIIRLLFVLKKHQLYYHTSWTCWDGSFHPKLKKNTPKVKKVWKRFLEKEVKHVFTVTQKSKREILNNYDIVEKHISVVYHSLRPKFYEKTSYQKKKLSFIYLGRLLPQKGITELLEFFSSHPNTTLTVVGNGKQEELVQNHASKYANIYFQSYIKKIEDVVELIGKHEYLVLNSIKTAKWEELFGLVIIESMALGTIPIATNHSGPREIITSEVGFLCKEGKMPEFISKNILNADFDERKSENAIIRSRKFHVEKISEKWKTILD